MTLQKHTFVLESRKIYRRKTHVCLGLSTFIESLKAKQANYMVISWIIKMLQMETSHTRILRIHSFKDID